MEERNGRIPTVGSAYELKTRKAREDGLDGVHGTQARVPG
jgi:hypothetical protein